MTGATAGYFADELQATVQAAVKDPLGPLVEAERLCRREWAAVRCHTWSLRVEGGMEPANPLSLFLCRPRLDPPTMDQVVRRLAEIDFADAGEIPEDLLVFYHRQTLREICALKKCLLARLPSSQLDSVDRWIWMVALNRLTGHSPGFFSVYTMPPNQAVTVAKRRRFNENRKLLGCGQQHRRDKHQSHRSLSQGCLGGPLNTRG